jgi:hypothetical protein
MKSLLSQHSDPKPPLVERRSDEEGRRFNVHWTLTAGHRKLGAIRGRVMNVSVSGILVELPAEYEIGTIIEIEMSPSFGVFIRALVKIVRLHCQKAGACTYGVVITSQKPEDAEYYRGLLLLMRRQELASDFAR